MKLFVFDLDGTLVDSLRDLAESANELLVACGATALPHDTIGRMVGDGAATLVARAFDASGLTKPSDALERFLGIYNSRLLKWTRPYPGIPETIAALGRRGTLAVLTNKPLGATRAILDGLDLAGHFRQDFVLGGDGPFPRKPDPAGLLSLIERTGVASSETVLVGDSLIDWRTTRAAGTPAALARYGFGFRGFPLSEIQAGDRHWLIDRPEDLLALL